MPFSASAVRELARLLESSNLGEISLESKGDKLTLKRAAVPRFIPLPATEPAQVLPTEDEKDVALPQNSPEIATKIIASGWVGVFHHVKTPLEVGATVKKGQHLGVVESLKVPFDITASSAGTLSQIFVTNGQGVEWGQPLFEITPQN